MAPHGSGNWTDWNSHDPGVTLLEVLAYSVSDLAADIGQLRAGKCGWRCTLVIAAAAAATGAAFLIRHRRSRLAAELER